MKRYAIMGMLLALCCMTQAKAIEVSAHSAILMDADTGQVLYEKNPREESLIASTTKIMTALVVLEQGNPKKTVTVPAEAVGIEGSSMYLKEGEELTVEQLLYGMMLSSGNDAAMALALSMDDSIEDFAARMNEKARDLGLSHTSFANPNGLDSEGNYSTAYDLAKITQAALNTPGFVEIVSAKTIQCGSHYLVNHNKLLWQYDGALGVKTGYTKKAGRILVGAAEQKGRRLISVTINAPNDWQDHKTMLDYGFSQYQETAVLSEHQQVGELPVMSGTRQSVPAVVQDGFTAYFLPEERAEITVYLPHFVYAPVEKRQKIGSAAVYLGEKCLGTLPVYAGADCPESGEGKGSEIHAGTCAKDFIRPGSCITAQGGGLYPSGPSDGKRRNHPAGCHRRPGNRYRIIGWEAPSKARRPGVHLTE